MADETTMTEVSASLTGAGTGAESRRACALVVAFCRDAPERVGEVFLPTPGEPGGWSIIGRGSGAPKDVSRRLLPARQRPDGTVPAGALSIGTLSREQLQVRSRGPSAIEVRNVGRATLTVDGEPLGAASRIVPVGHTLALGRSLLLWTESRPLQLPAGDVSHGFGRPDAWGMVGESPPLWRLRRELGFVAARAGHALVRGASGVGKELAAKGLHARSQRSRGPFVARNAATLPEGLVDAELFGHAANYPNAGMPARDGLVGAAHGGTLFLDEFAELPEALQTRLLRVLDQDGEYQRLGETRARRSDFRLVGATNRPLERIKPDVMARFSFVLELPDLNALKSDLPLLVRFLLRDMAASGAPGEQLPSQPSLDLVERLLHHPFSTNVRELRQLLWRALAEHEGTSERLGAARGLAKPSEAKASPVSAVSPPQDGDPLSPTAIQAALDRNNGSQDKTWRDLGLPNRHKLARLIKRYGLVVRKR